MSFKNDETYSGVITKKDLLKLFIRTLPAEHMWNYERQMNIGYCFAMVPILKKLYTKKEDLAEALKRHLVFFNTTPYVVTLPLGISAAMEEKRAADPENFDTDSITSVKASLMGPLAGIGDSIFLSTLRIIATGVGTSLAMQGNILGPILFFLVFNIPAYITRYVLTFFGYKLGVNVITKVNQSGLMNSLTKGAGIIGLMVMGAMSATLVSLTIPVMIGSGKIATSISGILDSITPGILPLGVLGIFYVLLKKKISPVALILISFVVGIIGAFFGVLK